MEFNKLPSDIKQLIFNNNRAENNNINRDKKLAEFWDKWGEDDLEDELYDWYEDGYIHHTRLENLSINDKIKIYKFHQKRMEVHESAMCDGSAPDWFYTP
tara:strand:- start:60 stop:359 length:300 start_codon:yes stop_codon:yes gene_type:complete